MVHRLLIAVVSLVSEHRLWSKWASVIAAQGSVVVVCGFSCSAACVIFLVQFSRSVMSDFETPWTAARQASLSITSFQRLFQLMSIESVMPPNHLILCRPLLLSPSIFPSIGVFSNESLFHIRWPKYWSFSFSISPSNEYSGLISLRMDWLDLLAVQVTLKSLLQQRSSKASILQHSAFFIVQLSNIHTSWIKPMSPAFPGGFLTTGPLGKSSSSTY